jgi:transcription-repair coupling factor (superfamily II helicase)
MPGLTDQQSLEHFWQEPQGSDRALFRRFYTHLIETTQINGNFDGRFPFAETDDQSRAIQEVLDDLAKHTPMDRLVCGDVGFGKTEVALRAAFVVAFMAI